MAKKLGIIYAPRLSASAAALAASVPLYRVGPDGFQSPAGRKAWLKAVPVINWGCAFYDGVVTCDENEQCHVNKAKFKLKTLTILKDASIPALEATGEANTAKLWVREGSVVLARKDGLSGGKGIHKIHNWSEHAMANDWPSVDFYVKYWKKTHEYRVHVFKGTVIDIQQKRRRTEWNGDYDPMIRNFDNGWVFCHENIKGTTAEINSISATSIAAVSALGLDFGAVDVLARFTDSGVLKKHVVCEVNTAPGLEGQTLDKYVTAIRGYLANV